LNDILGVPSRPKDNEATEALEQYFDLVNQGEGTSDEAKDLREKLENWLFDDPALTDADMMIERKERAKARQES
jgi:hypothetical protein